MDVKVCNICGTEIGKQEDSLRITKVWGYFSQKDTMRHSFVICEECYDRWISTFKVPVEESEETEIL